MAEKPETRFRRSFTQWMKMELENLDETSLQQLSLHGDPDKIVCLNSWYIALEFKAAGGKATPLQQHKLDRISSKGKGGAFVVEPANADEVKEILRRIDKGEIPPWVKRKICSCLLSRSATKS